MSEHPVVDWVTDANSCLLLGAGCSVCAGKPLMQDLSSRVSATLSTEAKQLFEDLVGSSGRVATVEDFLSQLLQMRRILLYRKTKKLGDWDLPNTEKVIKETLGVIIGEVGGPWASSPTHERFLRRLSSYAGRKVCDIYSVNYDLVLEATFEAIQLPYTDGFRGSENAYFDISLFEPDTKTGPLFRLFKLHGSINWIREENGTVRRRPYRVGEVGERQVIYPSEQKYYQTQYGVYESLLISFRNRLREGRPNNKLVVLGYSLSDEHVIEAIVDAVTAAGSNLTVYALLGPEKDLNRQEGRMKEIVARCKNRFNVMIGDQVFIGTALESSEWEELKSKNVWRFENLVDLMAGEAK